MIKNILKILLLALSVIFIYNANAINFNEAKDATNKIVSVSIANKTGNSETQIKDISSGIFRTFKIAVGGLLVAYIVYAGIMMIFSMGEDEKKLSSSKRSVWYAIVGLLFINIPGTLYNSLSNKRTVDDVTSSYGDVKVIYDRNIFMNSDYFGTTLGSVVTFLEIAIVALAVFMFIYYGIKIMLSSGDEKIVSEAKNKILWSLAGLIFIGIMEVWRNFVFIGDFKGAGKDMFTNLSNLALFFAGPIIIFFISLAGYYYITSGGDEEKVKKAKSIITNTLIAIVILIGMYTFLLDLKTLNF